MNSLSIVIPVYNEQENIEVLIAEILDIDLSDYNYEIILVDDCSTDKSFDILLKLRNKHNNISIFRHDINLGQSTTILTGIKNSKFENILTIDGDCQNDPKDIINLCKIYFGIGNYKLVGGLRTKRKDNYMKILSSLIANKIRSKILKDNGLVIIHRHKNEKDIFPKNFITVEQKKYGISKIIFLTF